MAEDRHNPTQQTANNGKLFSSSMFGFNKEEVLDYLEDMADENYRRQQTLEQRIQELNEQLHAMHQNENNRQQYTNTITDEEVREQQQYVAQLQDDLDLSLAATQQAQGELQEYKEQLFNVEKENAWLREEYQNYEDTVQDLRHQLEQVSDGQWDAHDEQVQQLQQQLQQTEAALQAAQTEHQGADVQHAQQASTAIIQEANQQAERIRDEAWADKERLHQQLRGSAGGLAGSISNLRSEVSDVEGGVTHVLEAVQNALSDVMLSLGRAEQDLKTLDTQVERFPSSSPSVVKKQPFVYFQPQEAVPPQPQAQPPQPSGFQETNWYGAAQQTGQDSKGFRRIWPDGAEPQQQPTNQLAAPASGGINPRGTAAPQLVSSAQPAASSHSKRNLAESLVDTIMQMID